MATSVTIRNLPDDVHEELVIRAARSGRSLQEYLRRELIALASKPDLGTILARGDARRRATETLLPPDTILRHREADRR